MGKTPWFGVFRTLRGFHSQNVLVPFKGLMTEYSGLFQKDGVAMGLGHVFGLMK
jgi:hypothetical protein